jgi:hypothetical protein
MSKMLKGPPGSPLGLCSGTSITSINPTVPFLSVPQVGQFAGPPQLFEIKVAVRTIAKATRGNIFDLIESPPTMFAGGPTTLSISCLDPERVRILVPAPVVTSERAIRGAQDLDQNRN